MDIDYIKSNWKNEMSNDIQSGIKSWNGMADNFGYDDKINFEENAFLKFLQEKTMLSNEMTVLDVGCGAGAYSFPISKKVKSVVGVDYSDAMIKNAIKTTNELGISNLEFKQLDWWNCDISEFEKKFYVVFAHMTPAISDYNSLMKMCSAATKYCVLCKHSRRKDRVDDEIKKMIGIDISRKDDAIMYIFNSLWLNGYNPEVSFKTSGWKKERTLEDAKDWYINRTKARVDVNTEMEEKILAYLEKKAVDGIIEEVTETTLVNIFWKL